MPYLVPMLDTAMAMCTVDDESVVKTANVEWIVNLKMTVTALEASHPYVAREV